MINMKNNLTQRYKYRIKIQVFLRSGFFLFKIFLQFAFVELSFDVKLEIFHFGKFEHSDKQVLKQADKDKFCGRNKIIHIQFYFDEG
jgi:hypothetical protein